MKKLLGILVLGLIVVGCATVKEVYMPSGEKAYAIDCSGTAMSREHCQKKAGELCEAKGYKVLSYDEEQNPGLMVGSLGVPGLLVRTLKIQCNL